MTMVQYVNDRTGLMVMTICFIPLTVVAVVLRFYARHLTKAGSGPDDWLSVAALFFTLALNGIFLGGTIEGAITGHSPVKDNWPVTIPLEITAQKFKYPFQVVEKLVFGLIKLSLLFLWKRLFGSSKRFRIACWVLIAFTIAWTVGFLLTTIFQCGSRWNLNWAPIATFLSQCIESLDVLTVFSATDIVTDLVIMGMPVPIIWSLQLQTRKKFGLTAVFLVGLFTLGAGVARLYMYLITSYYKEDNLDFIADFTLCLLWSDIEANVAMIVCCLPTFGPVLGKLGDGLGYSIRSIGLDKWMSRAGDKRHSKSANNDVEVCASSASRQDNNLRFSSDNPLLWDDGHDAIATAASTNIEPPPGRILARTDISTTIRTKS